MHTQTSRLLLQFTAGSIANYIHSLTFKTQSLNAINCCQLSVGNCDYKNASSTSILVKHLIQEHLICTAHFSPINHLQIINSEMGWNLRLCRSCCYNSIRNCVFIKGGVVFVICPSSNKAVSQFMVSEGSFNRVILLIKDSFSCVLVLAKYTFRLPYPTITTQEGMGVWSNTSKRKKK